MLIFVCLQIIVSEMLPYHKMRSVYFFSCLLIHFTVLLGENVVRLRTLASSDWEMTRQHGHNEAKPSNQAKGVLMAWTGPGVKIGMPSGQLPSKFGEGPQNVKTKGPNGPWKCRLILIHDL